MTKKFMNYTSSVSIVATLLMSIFLLASYDIASANSKSINKNIVYQESCKLNIDETDKECNLQARGPEFPFAEARGPEFPFAEARGPEFPFAEARGPEFPFAEARGPEFPFAEARGPEFPFASDTN